MKIIDEKGKLFGIINVVDLLVLILIIGFISVVFIRFYSQKLNANGGNPLTEKEDIYITLYASLVVPEIAENLQIGDKLVANSAYTSAEIVDIKVEPAAYVSTNSDGEAVLSEHPLWKDITVVIKDTVNPSSVILKAANQEVRVGYSFILKTQTVETNTKIRGVEFGGYTLISNEESLDEENLNQENLEKFKEDLEEQSLDEYSLEQQEILDEQEQILSENSNDSLPESMQNNLPENLINDSENLSETPVLEDNQNLDETEDLLENLSEDLSE